MEKHKKPTRPVYFGLLKPFCLRIPLLNLSDCLNYAIQEKTITDIDATAIIECVKNTSGQAGYWDMHWGDIENSIGLEQAKGFRAFYILFKDYEIKDTTDPPYPHLHFDVGIFS